MFRWEYGIRQWEYKRCEAGYAPTFTEYASENKARAAFAGKKVTDDVPLYELVRRRTIRGFVIEEQLIEIKD